MARLLQILSSLWTISFRSKATTTTLIMLTKRTHRERWFKVGIRQEVMITGVAQVIMKHKRSDSIYTRQRCNYRCKYNVFIYNVWYYSCHLFLLRQIQELYLAFVKTKLHLSFSTCYNMQYITRHQTGEIWTMYGKIIGCLHNMLWYFFEIFHCPIDLE